MASSGSRARPGPATVRRPAGHDTRAGERVELPPDRSRRGTVAVLASLGLGAVAVRRRPLVAVLSTGDELVEPGQPLGPGPDPRRERRRPGRGRVSRPAASAARPAASRGRRRPRSGTPCGDAALGRTCWSASGGRLGRPSRPRPRGASSELGRLELWRIAMQPGKPLAFGEVGGTPVSACRATRSAPSSPSSCSPGRSCAPCWACAGTAAHACAHGPRADGEGPRAAGIPAGAGLADGGGWYGPLPPAGQGSSQLRPLADANALLVVPEGERLREPGVVRADPAGRRRDEAHRISTPREHRAWSTWATSRSRARRAVAEGRRPHAARRPARACSTPAARRATRLVTARLAGIGAAKRTRRADPALPSVAARPRRRGADARSQAAARSRSAPRCVPPPGRGSRWRR